MEAVKTEKKKKRDTAKASGLAADKTANEELLAVIAAAIAAYEEDRYRQALYIKKLNRSAGARPAWGAMGTNEAINVRRFDV